MPGDIFPTRRKNRPSGLFWGVIALLLILLAICVSQVDQPEPAPAWECPLTVMYEDVYYTRSDYGKLYSLDGMEQVGVVQSCVPSTQMPQENYQTNVEFLLDQIIWEKDGLLYIHSNEEGVYWTFKPKSSNE